MSEEDDNEPAKSGLIIRIDEAEVENLLERKVREIRRRTHVVGAFPDGQSALMLAAARLHHVASSKWGHRRYMDMERLKDHDMERAQAAVS